MTRQLTAIAVTKLKAAAEPFQVLDGGVPGLYLQVQPSGHKSWIMRFICSACGADRVCNCNAPAVEKLAAKMEQDRQRARKAREKKAEQKQQPRHVRNGNDVDNAQSAEKPAAKTKVPHALAEAAAKYGRDFAIGRAGALYTVPRSTSEPANTEPVTEDHVAELDEMSARDKGYAERRRKRAQQDIGDLVDGFDIDGLAMWC
jgi:hypothetical protein